MSISFYRLAWRWRFLTRVGCDRLRAHNLAFQGAGIGPKVRIGASTVVDRPWCLHAGNRCLVEPRCYLKSVADDATIRLGAYSFLGCGTEIDCMVRVDIGDHSLVSPHCFIVDHNHGLAPDNRIDEQPCEAAPIIIGSDVWLGAGVVVLAGVTIGDGAVVGANAVVTKDVASGSIVAGVPAKLLRMR